MQKTTLSDWELHSIDNQLINLAFLEDLDVSCQDLTTAALFPEMTGKAKANIVSKQSEPIVLCGLPVVKAVLAKLDATCSLHSAFQDGDTIAPGEVLLSITGPAKALLMVERILLNFLQRLCAIATFTAKFVRQVEGTAAKILDTRKTFPGARHLEKYAVRCGGGFNHRSGLYDALMIKDTHVDFLGSMEKALDKLSVQTQIPVIVEVRSLDELSVVLTKGQGKVTRVLLDNMSPALMKACVHLCRHQFPTEASGNVSLENVAAIAATGVDFISIGKLTHSAGSVDLSMRCVINNE